MKIEVKIFQNKAELAYEEGGKRVTEDFEFEYFADAFLTKLDDILGQQASKKLVKLDVVCTDEASQLSCRAAKAIKQGLGV